MDKTGKTAVNAAEKKWQNCDCDLPGFEGGGWEFVSRPRLQKMGTLRLSRL
jgi:hypothetical protein